MTVTERGRTATYRLRGVMRDTDPRSEFATVTLELVRAIAEGEGMEHDEELSAIG
jgi:hypothetical protein